MMKGLIDCWSRFWLLCWAVLALSMGPGQAQELKLVLPVGSNCPAGVFSPNGQLVATTSFAGSIKIWDSWNGTLLQELAPAPPAGLQHDGSQDLAFSPDGRRLAAVYSYTLTNGNGPKVRREQLVVWELATGQPAFVQPVVEGTVYALFSPDGARLLVGDRQANNFETSIYDLATGQPPLRIPKEENYVHFSPDGTRLVSESGGRAKVWDARTGQPLRTLPAQKQEIATLAFSPDSRQVLITSANGPASLWDAATGAPRAVLEVSAATGTVANATFSPDGRRLLGSTSQRRLCQWDVATGLQLPEAGQLQTGEPILNGMPAQNSTFGEVRLSADCQRAAGPDANNQLVVWDMSSLKPLFAVEKLAGWVYFNYWFSSDGQRLAVNYYDQSKSANKIRILNAQTGQLLSELRGHTRGVLSRILSPTDPLVALTRLDGQLSLWYLATGTWRALPPAANALVKTVSFSPDGQRLTGVLSAAQMSFATWDVATGRLLGTVPAAGSRPLGNYSGFRFNADNTRLLLVNELQAQVIELWDVAAGRRLCAVDRRNSAYAPCFSADGKQMLTVSDSKGGKVQVFDAVTGAVKVTIQHAPRRSGQGVQWPLAAAFSPDGQRVLTSNGGAVKTWDAATGRPVASATPGPPAQARATAPDPRDYKQRFSPDGGLLLRYGAHEQLEPLAPHIWNTATGADIALTGLSSPVLSADFGPGGATVLATSADSTLRVWDAATGKLLRQLPHFGFNTLAANTGTSVVDPQLRYALSWKQSWGEEAVRVQPFDHPNAAYRLLLLDESDYLLYDQHFRYDGTSAARQLVNLACGGEVIGLNQLKDQLWVPGLARRLGQGEAIGATTIEQLGVCGLTPVVEQLGAEGPPAPSPEYRFRVRPQRGGLGQTVLAVNGIEVRRYEPAQLQARSGAYELRVPAADLAPYLVPGQANPVTVKAYTAENAIASRGAQLVEQPGSPAVARPNLYAVVVGVSDYKGDALDLKYAAKDAHDLGRALGASARRLLNHDGQEHVFIHELSTGPERERLPEKQAIKAVLDDICRRATATDIVLLFFAGHGVTAGADKRFYFLTADASPASAAEAGTVARVGISTEELSAWLHPSRLKAQKRVLVFDACQSGQAINDFVKLGGGSAAPYVAVRADDESQRLKAVEKLNEQAGLFILSASSSTQSAYEMDRYSQGLLTYSLLRAIKEQPDILEAGRYLSVARWFGAAESGVQELARASGQRQQPQLVSTANFNVGEVDAAVRSSIALGQQRAVFAASNFQNADPAVVDDDLDLSRLLDGQLQQLSARGEAAAPLLYAGSAGPEAYSLLGRYERLPGGRVRVQVSVRQYRQVRAQFEISGAASAPEQLAQDIAREAGERVSKLK